MFRAAIRRVDSRCAHSRESGAIRVPKLSVDDGRERERRVSREVYCWSPAKVYAIRRSQVSSARRHVSRVGFYICV